MNESVLDASALLAVINDEAGSDRVLEAMSDAVISAVNLSEVIAKLSERGIAEEEVRGYFHELRLNVVPFDQEQAYTSGFMRTLTRGIGLSFGDRACLGLAIVLRLPVLTADRSWGLASLPVEVRLIR